MRKVLLFVVASHSYVTSASSIGKDYLIHHLTIANGDIQTSIKFCVFGVESSSSTDNFVYPFALPYDAGM